MEGNSKLRNLTCESTTQKGEKDVRSNSFKLQAYNTSQYFDDMIRPTSYFWYLQNEVACVLFVAFEFLSLWKITMSKIQFDCKKMVATFIRTSWNHKSHDKNTFTLMNIVEYVLIAFLVVKGNIVDEATGAVVRSITQHLDNDVRKVRSS